MTLSRHTRHGLVVLTIAIAAMTSTGCVGPFGPCTARGPIIGNLRPVVVDGVPEPTAAVVTRTVCTPVSVVITVTIEQNEHPVEVVLDHSYPPVPDPMATVAPGGGSVEFRSMDENWTIRITHLDLIGTGDDLDYRIDWVTAPIGA